MGAPRDPGPEDPPPDPDRVKSLILLISDFNPIKSGVGGLAKTFSIYLLVGLK
jgi:hypothetical protein